MHQRYYKDYGLAIEGLVRHHKVEPLVYNSKVDDALPLEDVLKPDADLRKLLEDIDLSKVRLWLFTNAYITHGKRVVKLLGLDDLFEGITYCDYAASRFICKPSTEMFERAQRDAGITSAEKSFIIGRHEQSLVALIMESSLQRSEDSAMNCRAADALGWTTVHLVEPADALPEKPAARYVIRSLQELRTVFPQFFIS